MNSGELKQLVQLGGVFGLLAGVIGLAYVANWEMDRVFPGRSFTQRVCTDAYRHDARYETNLPYVDVPLTDGCFSGVILLPARWKTWQIQFTGRSDPAHWMSVWYGGMPTPAGPFLERQVRAGMTGGPSRSMRFQGRGNLRLWRLSEDPELVVKALISQAEQQEQPPPPVLIEASGAADPEFSMQLAKCRRKGTVIACEGYVTNKTRAPQRLEFHGNIAIDDGTRSFSIPAETGGLRFGNGPGETLTPGVSTRFILRIPDSDQRVSTLDLDFPLRIADGSRTAHFTFRKVRLN